MADWLLPLVPTYGLWLLAASTFLSCPALPFPASIMMMTASGIAGDQVGFWAGQLFGGSLLPRVRCDPARARHLDRAVAMLDRRGVVAVFLSHWLFSPLGPWVNLTTGSTGYSWRHFTFAGIAGEAASELLSSVLGLWQRWRRW